MKKWILLLVAIVAVVLNIGIVQGQGTGRSSHQADVSRTLELRETFNIIKSYVQAPAKDAIINVENKTNQSIKLQFTGGTAYTISPNSIKTIMCTPGHFGYEAQISGFPPLAGKVAVAANTEYSWVFYYSGP